MTRKERERVEKHFDELYAIAIGITPNIPDDISDALKASYLAGADYAIDMFAPRWISVEDELPPIDEKSFNGDWSINVLVAGTDDNTIGIDFYDYGHNEWVSSIDPITHWMPLPPTEGIRENQGKISPNRIIGTEEHIKIALDVMEKGGEQ